MVGCLEDIKTGFHLSQRAERASWKMLPCVQRSEVDVECRLWPLCTLSLMTASHRALMFWLTRLTSELQGASCLCFSNALTAVPDLVRGCKGSALRSSSTLQTQQSLSLCDAFDDAASETSRVQMPGDRDCAGGSVLGRTHTDLCLGCSSCLDSKGNCYITLLALFLCSSPQGTSCLPSIK